MGILNIDSRTENWKTAKEFAPFVNDKKARYRLVERLLEPLKEEPNCQPCEVKLELFWIGLRGRDFGENIPATRCRDIYQESFGDLREKVEAFTREAKSAGRNAFADLQNWNYRVDEDLFVVRSNRKVPSLDDLKGNLVGTEIDIILETPGHLLIGEAKHESSFDGTSGYVLAHQLIREYVMAKTALAVQGEHQEIVQFIVGTEVETIKKTAQVQFIKQQGWLKEENVLSWKDVNDLAQIDSATSSHS